MNGARLWVDDRARLGECVLWCDRDQALYWTDIENSVLSCRRVDGLIRRWHLPERVGSFALCQGSTRLLLGLASGIALFDPERDELSPVVPVEADEPATRINDGRCDRQGRFVFGMFHASGQPVGHFYRVAPDLRIERLPLPPAAVANSIAFSPDGTTMYYTDSPTRKIWQVAYGDDGRVGVPRPFVALGDEDGFPDGSCVDATGGLWNAQWDGGCVVRYDPQGAETTRIRLSVTRPTCPAFGGAELDRLYVTSALVGLKPAALERQPAAGGVWELEPGCRGLPESRFVFGG